MNPLVSMKCAGRLLMALVALASVLLIASCGSSGNSVVVKGGFTNASLKGTYSFTVKGYGFNANTLSAANFFIEGGVFTADGNKNITAGTDDFAQTVGNTTPAFIDTLTPTICTHNRRTGDP